MWFWLSLAALLCWSGSDLFSKMGCRDASDKHSHLKMISAVGVVMGLHAAWEIFIGGTVITGRIFLAYLPVSLLYILSMLLGYLGLRYIELSISSPICNASGAIVALLAICIHGERYPLPVLFALVLVCAGVVGLGIVEAREDEALRRARQEKGNYRYAKSILALILPIAYCLLDAAGTFADNLVLEKLSTVTENYESSANVAYELTFFAAGVLAFLYTFCICKSEYRAKAEVPKYVGAIFETAGQFAYIYAIADSRHLALSAPIISAYCAVSVLWSRVFLKEKLSRKHYLMIALVVIGIVILGVFDV